VCGDEFRPPSAKDKTIDTTPIADILNKKKALVRLSLAACARCSLCAESCFLFHLHDHDPRYMPSHKLIHSIGRLQQRKGRITDEELEEIKEIVWQRCVLCTRCYCPMGIDIPAMIALARSILRSAGVVHTWDGNRK
jgi:Fe-S oxidoreductase